MSGLPTTRSLSWSALWVIGCRIVGILATLSGNVMAARVLGPTEFGLYLFLTTVAAFGSLLAMAGLNDAALRFISENLALGKNGEAYAYLRRIVRIASITAVVAIGMIGVGLSAFQMATGRLSDPALLIALTVIAVIALGWQQLSGEILRAFNQLPLASLFSGGIAGGPISNVLFLVGMLGCLIMGIQIHTLGAVALLAGSVCLTVPFALLCVWKTAKQEQAVEIPTITLSKELRGQLFTVAGSLMALQLLAFAGQQLDFWIGEAVLPPHELGLYGVAKRLMLMAAMPVQLAMLTIVATIPRLHAQQKHVELQSLLGKSAALAAIPSFGALALLVAFPELFLHLMFGGSYDGAATAVRILAIGHFVLVATGNPVHTLALTGHHRTAVFVNLIAALVMIIGGPLAAARFGGAGLALASTAALVVQNAVLWWLARRRVGVWTHVSVPWPTKKSRSVAVPLAQSKVVSHSVAR